MQLSESNITVFHTLLNDIHEKINLLANSYNEDLQKDKRAENLYIAHTPFTRTLLRRLEAIATGRVIASSFFLGNATTYRHLESMNLEQQERAMSGNLKVMAADGSFWNKKFDDLTPRQQNMVYDSRSKAFRSDAAQLEWTNNNPVVKPISKAGILKPVAEIAHIEPKKIKAPTKSTLISSLKKMNPTAKDLSKLADASTLMAAAQEALKLEAVKSQL